MTRVSLVRILAAVVLSFCLAASAFFASAQATTVPSTPLQTAGQTATLLPDGSLLLVGGQDANGSPSGAIALRDAKGNERVFPVTP